MADKNPYSQPIITAVNENISDTDAQSHLATAANDMVNQMDSEGDTDFWHWETGYEVETNPGNYDSERTYLENALEEMYNSHLNLIGGDAIIIADKEGFDLLGPDFGYGFGGAYWSPPDSDETIWGARVYHTPSSIFTNDPVETFYNLAIHELAHTFTDQSADADHASGEYIATIKPDNQIDSCCVSPLATAYTYVEEEGGVFGENVDTDWPGQSDIPQFFCDNSPANFIGDEWCGGDSDPCRHITTMSDCIKSEIDKDTPL